MNCDDIRGLFSEYYDGGETDACLTEHFKECLDCASEYDKYRRLIDEVRNLPEPELPPDFHENMMAAVRKHAAKNKQARNPRRYALVAAAILWAVAWISGGFWVDYANEMGYELVAPIGFAQVESFEAWSSPLGDEEFDELWGAVPENEDFGELLPRARIGEPDEIGEFTGFAEIEPAGFDFFFLADSPPPPAERPSRVWLFALIGLMPLGAMLVTFITRKP